jgi:hypothetical protein
VQSGRDSTSFAKDDCPLDLAGAFRRIAQRAILRDMDDMRRAYKCRDCIQASDGGVSDRAKLAATVTSIANPL